MILEQPTVGELIAEWLKVIVMGMQQSKKNAQKMSSGLQTRIKPKLNKPRVLDHKTHVKQKVIQAALAKKLPHLKKLIYSEPAITDHAWKADDYIELYYDHYTIVIQKICEMTTSAR